MPYGYDWEDLAGTHEEIGRQHGQANAQRMEYLLKAFRIDLDGPWTEAEFLDPLERHAPGLAAEIHGIAAGSGLGLRKAVALSFYIDLGTAQTRSSACTGIVFGDGPDGPIVAKTSDCTPGPQQEWLRPRRIRPREGYAAVTHSHVGSPNAEMGMNEKGLAIGISGLCSRRTDPLGVGWQQDIRAVLHACATTPEALAMLGRIPIRHAGYAGVLGDASGDVAIFEKVVGALGVRRPTANVAYEANVALSPDSLPSVDPAWSGANSQGRMALLGRLCQQPARIDFSLKGMLDLFCTHAQPVSICQHGPELHSHVGFFMLPRKRQVHIARGYTCQRQIEVVQL